MRHTQKSVEPMRHTQKSGASEAHTEKSEANEAHTEKSGADEAHTVRIDRYLMFYVQSTAKGHLRAKQNIFLPEVKILILTIQHTFHR